tara:strand:- start:5246 stop:5392 length:147 start_codon:yes stop_codon:yes gene_type:complete
MKIAEIRSLEIGSTIVFYPAGYVGLVQIAEHFILIYFFLGSNSYHFDD